MTLAVLVVVVAGYFSEFAVWISAVAIILTMGSFASLAFKSHDALLQEVENMLTARDKTEGNLARQFSQSFQTQLDLAERNSASLEALSSAKLETESQIVDAIREENRLQPLRTQMEEVERGILASTEASHRSTAAALEELTNQLAAREADIKSKSAAQVRLIKRENLDILRQVEAMLQLFVRDGDNPRAPMPPTGNFALDAPSLLHLLHQIRAKRPRRILEVGSGTSTIWLAYLCRELGIEMVSIDHLENYAAQTRAGLKRHGLEDFVDVRLAPLQAIDIDGESFDWYDVSAFADLQEIDILIIDGPPQATGPRARFPALSVLHDRMSRQATIILDDAHREDEAAILESWRKKFPGFIQEDQGLSRLGILCRANEI